MAVRRFSFTLLLCLFLLSLQAGLPGQTNRKKTHSKKSSSSSAKSAQKLHHIKRAFVASADLQPMAQQLLEQRSPQAYAGVEEYAHRHRKDDAGPLAWLVIGYAHLLDKDYVKARESWTHSVPIEPVLGDYLDYFRAMAYQGESNAPEIIKTLEEFEQKYPDSVFSHDATMLYAGALMATGETQKAIALLEKHRHGPQSDLEFALGKAYLSAGEKEKASATFRHVYFDYPVAAEAELAAQELRSLGEMQPAGSFDQRRARADVLLKSRHYPEAVNEFSSLVEQAPSEKIADLQVEFATALYRAHKRDDAQRLFETVSQNANASVADRAQTLYFLAEIARDKDDHDRHGEFISELRTLAPESAWFQEALLSSGNMYMLKNDFEKAAPFYSEIYQRQQNGRFSPYAHWKAAWLTYRMGKKDEAKRLFEEQLTMYPSSNEAPAALYWRGRIAEEEGDKPLARAYYQKLSENYRYYYYANLGRTRLTQIGLQDVADPPMLDKLPGPTSLPHDWDAPTDNVRAQKAQVLENAALFDFAVKELQASASPSSPWLARAIAQVYQDQGSYIHAIETMKKAVPGYFSAEVSQLPRPVWEALFPRPYWDDLKRNSQLNQLDPYLMASLIRQESEFNPGAISPKNAMGLMQLLPPVGKGLAKEVKHHHFTSDELLVPATNLQLGTRYFRHMVEHYDGRVEYALAAYNAGEDRVDDWRKAGSFKDMDEFVESIPFTETREYVQAIMRNAVLYKLLYPKG